MRGFAALLILHCLPGLLYSQQTTDTVQNNTQTKNVEILSSDYLKFQDDNGKRVTRLVGNVELKQGEVLMWCDSANVDKETNSVDAWGRVHIMQDTVNAWSNMLQYDGGQKLSRLVGNCKLTDSKMMLYTDELFYDSKAKMSYYLTGGRVLKDSTVIVSKKAYYYSKTSEAFFRGDVHITDPNYKLDSDTLKYNTNTKVSTFFGNTEIFNKNSQILCDNGWYDSKNDVSSFGVNTVVINPPQRLEADSLYYERFRGFGKAIGPFTWVDSSMETEIYGCYGEYMDERQYIMATQQPYLIYKMDKDSLFLAADTLKSMTKSETDTTRNFFAYYKVRMFMKSMQGVCDSLFYSFADSTFRMYYKPVMWNEDVQMSGDTVYLFTKNKKADKFSIHKAGFIISPSGDKYFDQIKGTNIFGYFNDNELYRMNVIGNAESLYFGKDDKNKYIGNNKASSSSITIYFKDKKIDRIVFLKKPEAVFTPIKLLKDDQFKLKDFKWQIDRKPKSREELME
ncbi:MAG TPA: OstA-like protein [Chitinophagales bacterium]|nr:OstA-like protein [Chitinophagales bacterium]